MTDEHPDIRAMQSQITALRDAVIRIEEATSRIADATEAMARLEERHAATRDGLVRAFGEIEKLDGRIAAVEKEVPSMRLMRTVVFGSVLLLAIAAVGVIFSHAGLPLPEGAGMQTIPQPR